MKNPFLLVFPGLLLGISLLVAAATLLTSPAAAAQAASFAPQKTAPVNQPNRGTQVSMVDTQPTDAACRLPQSYPAAVLRWCSIIEAEAQKNNVDASLLAAVMLQESGGNPQAYSKSGAVGLMQIMPRDGLAASFQCVNGPCFASRPSMAELQDPAFNINFGARMLAGLIKKTGNVRDALKAYGPMDAGYSYADKVLAIHNRYH